MREEFINIDGNKIRYITTGSAKKNLVLIHGLGASAERWEPVLPYFSKHYNVIVPDLIGFGYSDKPNTDYTAEFFTQFVASFVDALGLDRTAIMGSSLGGQIAVEYTAANQQSVDRLILVSPAGAMKQSTPALDAYVMAALYPDLESAKTAFMMMTGNNKDVNQHIIDDFVQRMRLPNAKFAFMSTLLGLKNAPEITARLEKILVPTLVLWGELDPVIPVKYAEKFVREIRDCRFYQMENCGHTPYVDDPESFARLAIDFLNGHE
ncbi:MAG TPA: alpha/beta hydrolase [Candidatus Nitrosotenuis sp.]|nr:alpha/beta hydrolase [Candidatus Nitrosotenuis sp.]